jgi:hypothetical protein
MIRKRGVISAQVLKRKIAHERERERNKTAMSKVAQDDREKNLIRIGFGHIKIVHPRHKSERLGSTFCTKGILLSAKP